MKRKILVDLNDLLNTVQTMRENGEHDLRTVIYHVQRIITKLEKTEVEQT